MINRSFLGTGWRFPPTFDQHSGTVEVVSDEAAIQTSLHILLSTRLGERVMRADYGSNLDEVLFEPLTTTFLTYLRDRVRTAILYHEPRIDLIDLDVQQPDRTAGLVQITVGYRIRATNTRLNFVYPFYLNEGTNLTP
ncbi:GPW/gp25 family protein [Larkinella knui]|uniref:IraD/Gp25-like domain-containing protein n=1 Tax=Larkinella knui TaxID=2025310 RepID=A0A3P1CW18_9BACT|nr:GPW/gp25 family protein [Larkinella knui]RRB17270.1 hypothetical protein EHT87_03020 [Larkinella knui]